MSLPIPIRNDCDDGRRARAIESYQALLLALARRSLGDSLVGAATASDVVQETLMAATLADREGRGPGPTEQDLRLWLSTILKNKIREAVRRQGSVKRGGGYIHAPMPENVADDGSSPSKGAIANEEKARLDEAVGTLCPEDRQLVAWSIQDGLSRKEIGERMGVSASYASRICDRAEVRLRAAYRDMRREEGRE